MEKNSSKKGFKNRFKEGKIFARIVAFLASIGLAGSQIAKLSETIGTLKEANEAEVSATETLRIAEDDYKSAIARLEQKQRDEGECIKVTLDEIKKIWSDEYYENTGESVENIEMLQKNLSDHTIIVVRQKDDNENTKKYYEACEINGKPVSVGTYRLLSREYDAESTPSEFNKVLSKSGDSEICIADIFSYYNEINYKNGSEISSLEEQKKLREMLEEYKREHNCEKTEISEDKTLVELKSPGKPQISEIDEMER